MARAILICGKICCGKTTYAHELCARHKAVLLSIDELMLTLFGQFLGDKHDEYARRSEMYLLNKSIQLVKAGIDAVLDWGFWTRESRWAAKRFFEERGVNCELHYISICDDIWHKRIQQRNAQALEDPGLAYFVDGNLMDKFRSKFEAPEPSEIDVWLYV